MLPLEKLFIENVNGASIISIDTETQVKLTGGQSNPDQGKITKVSKGHNVMVFQNRTTNAYENMVNKRLAQEGLPSTFTVGPRKWGTRIKNTPFIEHNGEMYLEVIFLKAGDSEYRRNGKYTDKSNIQGLAEDSSRGGQGGLSNSVIINTYKFSSITAVTINGKRFVV